MATLPLTLVAAKAAGAFDASVGINIHPAYPGTEYADVQAWLPKLLGGGYQHIRTDWWIGDDANDKVIETIAAAGIKVLITADWLYRYNVEPAQAVQYLVNRPQLAASIYEIAGPNEVNANYAGWQSTLKPFMQSLYTAFKANPVTAHILVVAPNFDNEQDPTLPPKVGDMSQHVDEGDIHGTNGGDAQTDPYFAQVMPAARVLAGPTKPLVNTEGGYSYGTDSTAQGHGVPLPPAAVLTDVMHYYLEDFAHEIVHSDIYQLVNGNPNGDWGDRFGLLNDDYSPTPVYNAVKALTDLLRDPGAGAPAPGSLAFALNGADANTRSILLQKTDGSFWLAVWEQAQVFEYTTDDAHKLPVANAPVSLSLQLGSAASGAVYLPESGSTATVATFVASSAIAFAASPSVTLVQIKPAADMLVLHMSEDAYQGNANFTLAVDGQKVGDTYVIGAMHTAGSAQDIALTGNWGAGAHNVAISFINDAWGGSAATDRNLYVNGIDYDGTAFAATAAMYSNGTRSFALGGGAATTAPAADKLVMHLAEDAWHGNAQFAVTIDGQRMAAPQEVTALRSAGAQQDFTFSGNFGAGPHTVGVAFVNDAWGGSAATDRNLFVGGIDFDGHHYGTGVTGLFVQSSASFVTAG